MSEPMMWLLVRGVWETLAMTFVSGFFGFVIGLPVGVLLYVTRPGQIIENAKLYMGIPLEGLAFIAGVDRILDMARTALNVVGNALAVLVIAKWEHKFDRKKALAYERDVLGKFDKTANQ